MFVTSYSVTYCICIPGKPGICFHFFVQFMMSANNRIRFVLKIVFVCLYITPSHYHHCANLSEDFELIKHLSDIFCRGVSKIRHILSVIHYTIRGAVCFQFTHFLVMIDIIYIYSLSHHHHHHHHHQIVSMNYYPLFRFRSWNNGVRCMSFCILIVSESDNQNLKNIYNHFKPLQNWLQKATL